MQSINIANAFFARIKELLHAADTATFARQCQQLLETLFRELTGTEQRAFGNLFARMQFYFDKHDTPADIRHQLSRARSLTARAIRKKQPLTTEEQLLCAKALATAVSIFFQATVPDTLREAWAATGSKTLSPAFHEHPDGIPLLKCMITTMGSIQADGSFEMNVKNEEQGDFLLYLQDMPVPHLSILHGLLRPYDTIHVLHCEKTGNPPGYRTTSHSQVVLEPDLLIDISDLAECFTHKGSNSLLYLVKKLVPQQYNVAAFKGNLVNALLDESLRNHQSIDLKSSFIAAVSESALHAAVYGKAQLNEIFREIKATHWPNLMKAGKELQERPVQIEPSFYSSCYGLQGRLDIMAEDHQDPHRKEIFELKSGKPPAFNTWKNHEMQVIGYNLLLKSTFGSTRTGSSAILYSSASASPLRDVSSTHFGESELLLLRNKIVARLLRLAAGEYHMLNAITSAAATDLPSFSAQAFRVFEQSYRIADPVARQYYHHFLAFLLREWLQAKCGMYSAVSREEDADGFAALWMQAEQEKTSRFNIIPGLRFLNFDEERSVVIFEQTLPVSHNFRPGDTAVIYPRTSSSSGPLQQQLLKGRIEELGRDQLIFSLNNRQMTHDFFHAYDTWMIEHDMFESNYWMSAASLFYALAPQFSQRFRLLLGLQAPVSVPLDETLPPLFNANQDQLLRHALEAKDYYLLQGPPGTGKTSSLLTAMVSGMVERKRSVMVVAFTNKAVEEICRKLDDKGIAHMRMGGRNASASVLLRDYCLKGAPDEAKAHILNQRVLVGTVSTMASRLDLLAMMGVPLDTLIVDEASQLTEPQLLGMLMPFRKFILIGDQNQLPPVVAQHEHFCRVTDPMLVQAGVQDMRCSIFERLMQRCKANGWHHAWGMLSTHFRMHDHIAALINHYYAGRLTSGRPIQQAAFRPHRDEAEQEWGKVLAAGRNIFIPSPYEATSKMNRTEAAWVVSLLRHLRNRYGPAFTKDTVGVVTPWRTQISLIRELLNEDEELQQINIDTVERFQGSENDIIIVSLAVYHAAQLHTLQCLGNFEWEEMMIEVDRKLLVTLSRARQQVVLMGHEPVLRQSVHYTRVLGQMEKVYRNIGEEQPLQQV